MQDVKLEQITKGIAILVGLSYAVGIMVSNEYLASVGVLDFDLLRPRAVVSGLWFILFFAVAIVAEDSIQHSYKMKTIPATWRLGNALVAFCGAFVIYYLALTLLTMLQPVRPKPAVLASLLMFVSGASFYTEARNAVKEWKRRRTDERVGPTSAAFFLWHCAFSIGALVVFAVLFVANFYRFVPQQYGGGKPRTAQIAVSDKVAETLNAMSVLTTKNVVDGSVDLIHENPETIAFRPNGGGAIILPRGEVLVIRVR